MIPHRIYQAIIRTGLSEASQDPDASLEQAGLDSLMLALLILELEREFHVKIPVIPLVIEHFYSINSIERHLCELGVQ